MMSKIYTAKELRDTADHIYADYGVARIPISETPLTYKDVRGWEIAAMLRQAADVMERAIESKDAEIARLRADLEKLKVYKYFLEL